MSIGGKSRGTGRPVRVEDVARVAGVSPITVSRALSVPDKVKPETRQKVAEAVAKTGYVVNPIASSLRSGQSSFVSVLVASLRNLQFAEAMQGLIDAVEGSRFHLTFTQSGYAEEVGPDQIRALLPYRPAAIVFSGIVRNEETRTFLRALNIPILEMWGEAPDPIDLLVTSQSREGGRQLGEHLLAQGFERIAYVGHTISRSLPRIEGLRDTLKRHGKDFALLLPTEGTASMKDGFEVFDVVLDRLPDCDVIVFGSDVMAAGALVRARQRGIRIPEEIALAGYGDLFFSAYTQPALTSLRTTPYELGLKAGKLLLARLHGETIPDPVIEMPVSLMARPSTIRDAPSLVDA